METTKHPYELLVRWDRTGDLAGAHVQHRYVTTDGGVVVGETLGPAEPVTPDTTAGTPFADFLDAALVAALGQVAALTTERDALAAERDTRTTERDALAAQIAALTAERDALASERDALAAQMEASPVPAQPAGTAVYAVAVQAHLDAAARSRGYESITTAVTYIDDPNPTWAAEGAAAKEWRSAVWTACYAILAEVEAGTRPAPTVDELLAGLPPLVWPA